MVNVNVFLEIKFKLIEMKIGLFKQTPPIDTTPIDYIGCSIYHLFTYNQTHIDVCEIENGCYNCEIHEYRHSKESPTFTKLPISIIPKQ